MKVRLHIEQAGKRFDRHWVFKNLSHNLEQNQSLGVLGSNGSGKSTFLLMLSGYLRPTEGGITVEVNGTSIPPNRLFEHVAIAAPYAQLLDDLTLTDMLEQHASFMPWNKDMNTKDVIRQCLLDGNEQKALKFFSSGMKQRLKLGMALFSQRPIVLLDEPTSNLDQAGVEWYQKNLKENSADRIIVVGSNEPFKDVPNPDHTLTITDYKISKG